MRRLWSFSLCFCLASCGESGSKYGDHPPYPASGQVLLNGEPAKGVLLTFYHSDNWGEKAIVPQAKTDDDGRFVLSTYGVKDGAPAGDYRVTVEWPAYIRGKDWGPDKLGGKYAKPDASGLTAHLEKGKNELKPFELQVASAQIKATEAAVAKKKKSKKNVDDR